MLLKYGIKCASAIHFSVFYRFLKYKRHSLFEKTEFENLFLKQKTNIQNVEVK